jgi:uncharacterized membrane protein
MAWGPAALALLAWLGTAQHTVMPVRWAAGLLLAFVLPGFAATGALFHGRSLSRVERTVLAPALSLAVLVLGGLLVYALGLRLTAGTWGGLTALATVVSAGVGYLRWLRSDRGAAPAVGASAGDAPAPPAGRRQVALKLASLLVAAGLLAGAFATAWRSAVDQGGTAFTALSIVQADDANPNDALRPVSIAVDSHETEQTQYLMRVRGAQGVLRQFSLSLGPGEVWKTEIQVPIPEKITVELFKGAGNTPYRTVFLSGLQ